MSRLVTYNSLRSQPNLYQQLHPKYNNEIFYEELLAANAKPLFPKHHLLKLKTEVELTSGGTRKADLVLLDEAMTYWYVVEVELAHHDFDGDVLPQISDLVNGIYDAKKIARYLISKNRRVSLDKTKLENLFSTVDPRFIAILNHPVEPSWAPKLASISCHFMVIEFYKGKGGLWAYRLIGDNPVLKVISEHKCKRSPSIPRYLVFDHGSAPRLNFSNSFSIRFEGFETEWNAQRIEDEVLIRQSTSGADIIENSGDSFILAIMSDRTKILRVDKSK